MTTIVGRWLQVIGMILLPLGLMYGLVQDDIKTEVRLLTIGGFVYVAGWLLARKRD